MKTEKLETKILNLYNENFSKGFTFESIKKLLSQKTRKEKIQHSLQVLCNQKRLKRNENDIYFLTTKNPTSLAQKNTSIKKESNSSNEYVGKVEISSSGLIFISVDGFERDVIIRQRKPPRVLNGDLVKIKIKNNNVGKRAEGEILNVESRSVNKLIAKIEISKSKEKTIFAIPLSRKNNTHYYISQFYGNELVDNQYVVIEFENWYEREKNPRAKIIEVLDYKSINDIEMKSILLENGFDIEFEKEVIDELKKFEDKIDTNQLRTREDFRDILTFTIDPKDAKDYDDALSINLISKDLYQIGIHIADVSHFVRQKSKIDTEAAKRTTSIYLPDRVIPMLPELLSNNLCSLIPNKERYAFSVILDVNTDGEILNNRIVKTIIKSNHRFAYEDVQEILDKNEGLYNDEIQILAKIAKIWRNERYKKGAMSFSSKEIRFEFDSNNKPIRVFEKIQTEANHMIEDYMLKANVLVATFLAQAVEDNKIDASIYRNHDLPNLENLEKFSEVAFNLTNKKVKPLNNLAKVSTILNDFLSEVEDKHNKEILNRMAIRCMAKAAYSTKNIGHYGLAFDFYSHFTSPIRRYPDLLVHRLLGNTIYNYENNFHQLALEESSLHCSNNEKLASECEREAIKYKQVEFLNNKIDQAFSGIITGGISTGFWVELDNIYCEGFVDINILDEKLYFDPKSISFNNSKGFNKYFYGQHINVKIQKVDMIEKKVWLKVI